MRPSSSYTKVVSRPITYQISIISHLCERLCHKGPVGSHYSIIMPCYSSSALRKRFLIYAKTTLSSPSSSSIGFVEVCGICCKFITVGYLDAVARLPSRPAPSPRLFLANIGQIKLPLQVQRLLSPGSAFADEGFAPKKVHCF